MFFRTILGLAQTSRRRLHSSARLKFWFLDPSKKSVPTIYKARQEPWLTPTMVLLGIMPIFTFALGTWQLKRLKWKINLIDELEEKLHSQPLRLPPSIKFSTFLLIKCQLTEVNQSRSYTWICLSQGFNSREVGLRSHHATFTTSTWRSTRSSRGNAPHPWKRLHYPRRSWFYIPRICLVNRLKFTRRRSGSAWHASNLSTAESFYSR